MLSVSWWKHGEPESTGPSKSPASATAARSTTNSPIATAGRGGGEAPPLLRKTPKGRFWMGKCEPTGTSTNDRSCFASAIAASLSLSLSRSLSL
uniref:Uncharacterized protein n=1 Tax=Arundo donax TaxID=35708 RepID=A0A0A9DAE1_ARUDO